MRFRGRTMVRWFKRPLLKGCPINDTVLAIIDSDRSRLHRGRGAAFTIIVRTWGLFDRSPVSHARGCHVTRGRSTSGAIVIRGIDSTRFPASLLRTAWLCELVRRSSNPLARFSRERGGGAERGRFCDRLFDVHLFNFIETIRLVDASLESLGVDSFPIRSLRLVLTSSLARRIREAAENLRIRVASPSHPIGIQCARGAATRDSIAISR